MATIDLKNAYYLVPMREEDKKLLRFVFKTEIFEFQCLPFGLNTAPFTFTKLMKPIVSLLRSAGFKSVVYLDDLLLFGDSFENCELNVRETLHILRRLGFVINDKKSKLIPSTRCKFLGFIYDSVKMTVELPNNKRDHVLRQIENIQLSTTPKIRELAILIGSLGACCSTLKYGRVHLRSFEREKFLALQSSNENFEARFPLAKLSQVDLEWWKQNIPRAINSITWFKPVLEIFTDASTTGWGAFCEGKRAHGFWDHEEKSLHINNLELRAAFMGLKGFASTHQDCDILMRIDNTTAIAYINKKGGIQFPQLCKLARDIWDWCEARENWVFASYIASKENVEADFESRRLEPETEYALADEVFGEIVDKFGHPEVDLFANRINKKCKKFDSWKRDPEAIAIDAFTLN